MRTPPTYIELYPLALQHYVAGRILALQTQIHVAGNILHHAVELFLKAELSGEVTIKKLRNKYAHNLTKLWATYSTLHTDVPDDFAATIADIDSFEEIRYPSPEVETVGYHYSLFKDPNGRRMGSPCAYSLNLECIDELIAFMISKSPMKSYYLGQVKQLPQFSVRAIFENNKHHPSLDAV